MEIIWKHIIGYEGWYEVSNTSQVRSLNRRTTSRNAIGGTINQKIQNSGYLYVTLCKNGKEKNKWHPDEGAEDEITMQEPEPHTENSF